MRLLFDTSFPIPIHIYNYIYLHTDIYFYIYMDMSQNKVSGFASPWLLILRRLHISSLSIVLCLYIYVFCICEFNNLGLYLHTNKPIHIVRWHRYYYIPMVTPVAAQGCPRAGFPIQLGEPAGHPRAKSFGGTLAKPA